MTAGARLLVASAVLVLASACGIPVDSQPRPVSPPPGPAEALASPAPETSQSGGISTTLYLVKDGAIVATDRASTTEWTAESVVDALLAGPTEAERTAGFSSAIPAGAVVHSVRVEDGTAVVDVGAGLESAARQDLAFGQIVCALDARSEINGVTFLHDGQLIGVPDGEGVVTKGPLTTADYEVLLTSR
jgi:hypothetical protein